MDTANSNDDTYQLRHLRRTTRFGEGLVVAGFIIVLSSMFAVQSLNRKQSHQAIQLEKAFDTLVTDSVLDHLTPWKNVIRVTNADPKQACADAKNFAPTNSFFAFDAYGIQMCGPAIARRKLADDGWVALGDGNLSYSKITFTGSVIGVRVPIDSVLPKLREGGGLTVHLVSGGDIVASTPTRIGQPRAEPLRLSDLEVRHEVPGVGLSIAYDKPLTSRGWTTHVLYLVRPLGILILIGGVVIRFYGPWAYWWRRRGAPDGVRLFVFDRNGSPLQWGGTIESHPTDEEIVRVSEQNSVATIQSLIVRARNGEVGATDLFVDGESTYRYYVVAWSDLMRRGVMLVSKMYTDPFSKIGSVLGNSSTATVLDVDGLIWHVHGPHLRLLDVDGNPLGVPLISLFPERAREKFETLRQTAIDQVGRVVNMVLPLGWRSLRVFVLADDRGACFVWFSDVTEARQGKALKAFVRDCVNYMGNPVGRRPDMNTYRMMLDPDGMSVDPTHNAGRKNLGSGQEVIQLVNNLSELLSLAETVKFGAESPAAQRFRAARRREVARIIHDTVIQDLILLRWKLQTGEVGSLEITEQLIIRVRGIVTKLRTPPWETQMQSLIGAFLQPVKDRGVAVSVHSTLEEPLDNAVLAAIAIVAKESVNNALKHADPTEICVDVRTRNRKVVLTVSDSGSRSMILHGVHHSNLLDTTNPLMGGHKGISGGTGLSQCQEIAADLNGEYRFESQPGGHLAILTLPLAEPIQPMSEPPGSDREFEFMYLDVVKDE